MQIRYKPETTVEAYRLTPQNIREIAGKAKGLRLVIKDMMGYRMDPLDWCLKMKGLNGDMRVALIGDWVLRDRKGDFSFESNETIGQFFDLPLDASVESAILEATLAQRDRFEPQYGLTEDQTRMVANLQALKKMLADRLQTYPLRDLVPGSAAWFMDSGWTVVAPPMSRNDVIYALRGHFVSRAKWVGSVQDIAKLTYGGWTSVSRAEQEKHIARVLNPSRIIDEPDYHDLAYLRNYDLAVLAIRPGAEIGPRKLIEFHEDIGAWHIQLGDAEDRLPLFQSFAETLVLLLAQERVKARCIELRGADAYSRLSPGVHEELIGREIEKINPNYREVDDGQMDRPRG